MKTTNYEISKKLKEAGFEAETDYNFIERNNQKAFLINIKELSSIEIMNEIGVFIESYDLETLLDALPKHINQDERQFLKITFLNFASLHYREWDWDYMEWVISNSCEIIQEENESLADTAGKMWLLLKEKGVL